MHTLVAFYGTIANGAVLAQINAVLDQTQTLDANNRLVVPYNATILAAYGQGINASQFQVTAPSLLSFLLPQIYPANPTADIRALDGPVVWGPDGFRLIKNESVWPQVSRAGAGPLPCSAGLWMTDGLKAKASGPCIPIRGTTTPTLVAGSWVQSIIAFDQALPAGRYGVNGMAVVSPQGLYARLIYPGGGGHRPGVVVQNTYGDLPRDDMFRMGRMGSFGEFESYAPPSVEIIGDTAGAAASTIILDVVKIR